MNSTKKIILPGILFFFGYVLGVFTTVNMCGIGWDFFFETPHLNQGVRLTSDLIVEQNDIELILPKNTELLLNRKLPGGNEYCLLLEYSWDNVELIGTRPICFKKRKGEPTR